MISEDVRGPRLVELVAPHREHLLGEGEQILGRGTEATVVVDHEDVSRRHARVTVVDEGLVIEDLGSKNGVFVNGAPVREPTRATHGDRVSLGRVELELVHPRANVHDVLAGRGEATVTRVREDLAETREAPGLLLPLLGVMVFGALVAVMLLL